MSRIVDDLREHQKMKYMGDCKCGQCQLVPLAMIAETATYVETLEAKVATLQDLLRVPLGFPPGWNLTPGEERLLSLLTRRGEQGVTHDAAAFCVSSHPQQRAKPNTVRDAIGSLRRKVLNRGISIGSLHGRGYAITGDSLAVARGAWGSIDALSHVRSQEK